MEFWGDLLCLIINFDIDFLELIGGFKMFIDSKFWILR